MHLDEATMRVRVILAATLLGVTPLAAQQSTVAAVQRSKHCGVTEPREASAEPPMRYCEYRVDESLAFTITWTVPSARIDVARASDTATGYRFAYDTELRCIVIQPGLSRLKAALLAGETAVTAYVSTKTGGVFATEAACKSAF